MIYQDVYTVEKSREYYLQYQLRSAANSLPAGYV